MCRRERASALRHVRQVLACHPTPLVLQHWSTALNGPWGQQLLLLLLPLVQQLPKHNLLA